MPSARALAALVPLLPAQLQEPAPRPAAPLIERIEIANNQFLQKDTLLFYVATKPGEPFACLSAA
jgi:hypothetical protein